MGLTQENIEALKAVYWMPEGDYQEMETANKLITTVADQVRGVIDS